MGCKVSKAADATAIQKSKSFDTASPSKPSHSILKNGAQSTLSNGHQKSASNGGGNNSGSFGSDGHGKNKTKKASSPKAADTIVKLLLNAQTLAKKATMPQQQASTTATSPDGWQDELEMVYTKIMQLCEEHQQKTNVSGSSSKTIRNTTSMFTIQDGTTGETPLILCMHLLDYPDSHPTTSLVNVVHALIRAHAPAVRMTDYSGHLPLHHAMNAAVAGPTTSFTTVPVQQGGNNNNDPSASSSSSITGSLLPASEWRTRSAVVQLLVAANVDISIDYMRRNNVVYAARTRAASHQGCSPLYRALQTIPDDFDLHSATVEYIAMLRDVCASNDNESGACCSMVGVGNAADGDRPLALLYRRFTRQFDLAEKFFDGDNSRPQVVEHRRRYKTAAGNTWRIIESLLRPESTMEKQPVKEWKIVHRAVQVEAPPDLLRYIVETNAEDLTKTDHLGNLPIHYAAKSKPNVYQHASNISSRKTSNTSFPAFYTKYVVDELLYKFPEAASMPDAHGDLPFKLAVDSGKQWIGGGIKSLYDAHPAGLEQVNLEEHLALKKVLTEDLHGTTGSTASGATTPPKNKDAKQQEQATTPVTAATTQKSIVSSVGLNTPDKNGDVIPDEQHDAIMLVQQPNVDISEVVCSMWAHEEDAGVQMLSCVAIARMVETRALDNSKSVNDDSDDDILRIALSAVAAVVNAMKAHPNEVIVQEKACHALALLARTDGQREISFVALGAVAAVVGAMQAHVSDAGAQEEACAAIAEIIRHGGADRATIVASVSGLTALVNAIAAHPNAAGVQEQACRALRELTEYPHANLPDLPRSQTEPLLQQAKSNFPSECQESVDLILSRLS